MFIIKTHYEATESNKHYAGQAHDWYKGMRGHHLAAQDEFPTAYFIQEYGYKTLAAARRGLKAAKNLAEYETGLGHWIVTAEIVEVN